MTKKATIWGRKAARGVMEMRKARRESEESKNNNLRLGITYVITSYSIHYTKLYDRKESLELGQKVI